MRATIFNIFAILSLFSVGIHASPPADRYAPRSLPECPIIPIHGGIGPACSPRPTVTATYTPRSIPECPIIPIKGGGHGPVCSPRPTPTPN